MNIAAFPSRFDDLPAGVSLSDDPEGLAAIQDRGCAAAIWRREVAPSFQRWIDGLDPAVLPKTRVVLRPERVRAALTTICDEAQTPEGVERTRLIDDISALAEMFSKILAAPYLRVRLDAITTNACRKFHVDVLTARLVCTYRGTATQLGTGRADGDPARILTCATGSPVVLRGSSWPEQPRSGLLHRSPPIEGSGETRLLLVLDPISDPEQAIM